MTEIKRGQKELRQYLTFILDGEEYGVPILKVNGIQGWERTTPIPNSPDYVMGIINLRGEVVPIIDLRKRFGLEKIPYDSHTVVIVVRIGQNDKKRTVGLVVDAVADVHDIDQEQIHSTPEFGGKISDNFVRGLGMIGEKMVILLEIDNLIDWKKVSGDDKNTDATGKTVENLAA
jgi:purine-binding chemotaxis protein CheW